MPRLPSVDLNIPFITHHKYTQPCRSAKARAGAKKRRQLTQSYNSTIPRPDVDSELVGDIAQPSQDFFQAVQKAAIPADTEVESSVKKRISSLCPSASSDRIPPPVPEDLESTTAVPHSYVLYHLTLRRVSKPRTLSKLREL